MMRQDYQKCEQLFFDYLAEYVVYQQYTKEQIQEQIKSWKPQNDLSNIRPPFCSKDGGRIPNDEKLISKARNLGLQMAKEIGKQFFSGKLNLTTVTMPIEINICKTALESLLLHTCYFPLFMGVILNPILGETFQGHYNEGTQLFCEQISHHPPISYFQVYGKNYLYYGYYDSEARAGFNRRRKFVFNDGQTIECSFAQDKFSGMFMGTPCQELTGSLIFVDKINQIQCQIKLDSVSKMPSDYFASQIIHKGKIVGEIKGSYLSNVDIDGERYFDFRYMQPYQIIYCKDVLQSDSILRQDLQNMKMGINLFKRKNR